MLAKVYGVSVENCTVLRILVNAMPAKDLGRLLAMLAAFFLGFLGAQQNGTSILADALCG